MEFDIFSKDEIALWVMNELESGYEDYYCSLPVIFRKPHADNYVTGQHEAEKMLEKFGVFKALNIVAEYNEKTSLEKVDLSDPEEVANMLWIIKADQLLLEGHELKEFFAKHWFEKATDESNNELASIIIEKFNI